MGTLLTASLVMLLTLPGAIGRQPQHVPANEPTTGLGLASAVPASADLVMSVRDAAGLRTSPFGTLMEQQLAGTGLFQQVRPAWEGLSRQLGLTHEQAFDALLGREVWVIARGGDSSGGGSPTAREWLVMSRVSSEMERRVRENLRTAPLAIERGVQIFSIEDGGYALTSVRSPDRSEDAVLLLAPSGKRRLFDETITAFTGPDGHSPTLRATALARSMQHVSDSRVLIAARLGAPSSNTTTSAAPETGPAESERELDAWERQVVLSGSPLPDHPLSWRTSVVVRGLLDQAAPPPEPTSDRLFNHLSAGSLLCMVESPQLGPFMKRFEAPTIDPMTVLQIPPDVRATMNGRSAVWMRSVAPDRIAGGLAVETNSISKIAPAMDTAMATFAQRIERQFGGTSGAHPDFGGALPEAVRVLRIHRPQEEVSAPPRDLTIGWTYVARQDPVLANDPPAQADTGWWAVQLSQAGEAGEQEATDALLDRVDPLRAADVPAAPHRSAVGPESDTERVARWLLLASIRPADLETHLPAVIPDIRGVRTAMRHVESLTVRIREDDDQHVIGDLDLTLRTPDTSAPQGEQVDTPIKKPSE